MARLPFGRAAMTCSTRNPDNQSDAGAMLRMGHVTKILWLT